MSLKEFIKRATIAVAAYVVICVVAALIILPFAGYANFWEYAGLAAAIIFIVFSAVLIILTVRRMVLVMKISKAASLFEGSPEAYIKALGELSRFAKFPEDKFIVTYNMAAAELSRGNRGVARNLLLTASELSVSKRNLALCREALDITAKAENFPTAEE